MAVKTWAESLNRAAYKVSIQNLLPEHNHPPRWILIERLGAPL
jgi:hypothetical protein